MIRLLPLLALVLIGACAQQPPTRTPAQAAAAEACRQQADATLTRRERSELSREDSFQNVDREDPTRQANQLGRRFERDRMIQQCIRGASGGS